MGVEDDLERLIEERMVPVRRLLSSVDDPQKSAQAAIAAVSEVLQTHVEALRLLARAIDDMALDRTRQNLESARQQLDTALEREHRPENPAEPERQPEGGLQPGRRPNVPIERDRRPDIVHERDRRPQVERHRRPDVEQPRPHPEHPRPRPRQL